MSEDNGSVFMVPVVEIVNVRHHPNADRLDIVKILGFETVATRDMYKIGDSVLYIPVDSILPADIEKALFANSKMKLTNSRVRAAKIRGFVSEGMISKPELLGVLKPKVGKDYKELLQIHKYQPPERNIQGIKAKTNRVKLKDHPLFHSYNGLNRIQWQEDLFTENDLVVVQEKIHGTNARYSILPYTVDTLWRKILHFLKLTPKFEKNYGSNNVQISRKFGYKGFYGTDIYGDVGKKEKIFDKLQPNEIVYGEIVGPGIQKGYSYGLNGHEFFLFDVKIYDPEKNEMKWLNPLEVLKFAKERGFKMVPIVDSGRFDRKKMEELATGPSLLDPTEKVREGVVVKSVLDYNNPLAKSDRKALKVINPEYLLNPENTDEH